jgi:hypothetical protein
MNTEVSNTAIERQAPQNCLMDLTIPATNTRCDVKMILDWSDELAAIPENEDSGWYVNGALYFNEIPNIEFLRYLKTQYKEWDIFFTEFVIPKKYHLELLKHLLKEFIDNWDKVNTYSHEEASAITNTDYKELVLKCF